MGRRLALEGLEPRLALDAAMLRITELVASNDNGLQDYDGAASDWLEIFNAGAESVDLTGLYLTDSPSNLTRWAFPSGVTIEAGGYRVVFASSKDTVKPNGELHTSFALSAGGEFLALIAADGVTILDQYAPEFPAQIEDVAYGRDMTPTGVSTTLVTSGAQARAWVPTSSAVDNVWMSRGFNDASFNIVGPTGLGYEQNPGDSINYTAEIRTGTQQNIASLYVRIPFTVSSLADIGRLTLRMKYDDGFKAYINGVEVAAANAPDGAQWNSQASGNRPDNEAESFESFDVSAGIQHLRSGSNVLAIHGLNLSGGSDMLILPELIATGAAISAPEQIGYFDVPTPGYSNGESYAGFVNRPQFSVPHGFYSTAQAVSLATATPGAVIVYTTNGSTPAVNANLTPTNGTLYTGPISVSATTTLRAMAFKLDYKPSFVASSTYLFLDDVLSQSPQGQTPAGWPASGVNGQAMDYGMDPEIINLYGAETVKESLLALPSLSLTTDLANLFNPSTGIYVNALNDGRSWERPTSVELLNPDGSAGFSANAGLRIRGGYSRNDFVPKHSLRLYFRSEYGDSKLNYALFGDEGPDEFDVIDLRTEQNYAWSSGGDTQNSFVREVFSRDLQRDLGDPYTRSRYYHLYLDGVYWGIYQTQERVEENYGQTYFGGEEEDYDVLKHGLNDGGGFQVNTGNDAAWFQLFSMAEALAGNPTANANNYYSMQGLNPDGTRNPSLPVLLDVDNLVNYMLIVIYTGGYDTGISLFLGDNQANNWYALYNREAADQGFKFFLHDNEHALGAGNPVHGTQSIDRTGPFNNGTQSTFAYFNPVYLHQDLLAHPEYRMRVVERVQEHMLNDGQMTAARSVARMNERANQVRPAIIAEAARWGDSFSTVPRNKTTWETEITWLRLGYFPTRTNTVLNQLRGDGLFVAAPRFNPVGGALPGGSSVSLVPGGPGVGAIYYTTDGVSDPRLTGGGISPAAAAYTNPIVLNENTLVKARYRTSTGQWSVLAEAAFTMAVAGDYDGNAIVDGADLLAWQRQFGAAANPAGTGADGNADGTVNGLDLDVWKNAFELPPQAAAASASIDATAVPLVLQSDASAAGARQVNVVASLAQVGWIDSLTMATAHHTSTRVPSSSRDEHSRWAPAMRSWRARVADLALESADPPTRARGGEPAAAVDGADLAGKQLELLDAAFEGNGPGGDEQAPWLRIS